MDNNSKKHPLLLAILFLFLCSNVFATENDGITLESTKPSSTSSSSSSSPLKFDENAPSVKQNNAMPTLENKDKIQPPKLDKVKITNQTQANVSTKSLDKNFEKAVTKDSDVTNSPNIQPKNNAAKNYSPFTPQEKVDIDYIQILNKEFVKEFNAANIDGLINISRENIVNIPVSQKTNIGIPKDINSFVFSLPDANFSNVVINEPISLEVLDGYAIITGTGSSYYYGKNTNKEINFKYTATLNKKTGTWQYSSFHFASSPDEFIVNNNEIRLNILILALGAGILLGSILVSVIYKIKNK